MDKPFDFLTLPSTQVAPRLLGCELSRRVNGREIRVKIVEVEAYDQTDAASHSYHGLTARNQVMFGDPGRAYVYFTYGMHFCLNIVTEPAGRGSAVLIRAAEPLSGIELIRANRPNITSDCQLTNGPAKLCLALQIGPEFNGHDLSTAPLKLIVKRPVSAKLVIRTTRIGISRDTDRLWRYYIDQNRFVSHL